MQAPVTIAVEGTVDAVVARCLLTEAGLCPGIEYVRGGKDALDQRLLGYNAAARHSCWLVLRDLDQDAACAAALRRRLLPQPAERMRFAIATCAIEAWLLADFERMARALCVPERAMHRDPETIPRPKRALVDLARGSRMRSIREALAPAPGTTASVGPGYSAFLIEFAAGAWRPAAAAERSPSLALL